MTSTKRGDVVPTPAWVAFDMCEHFKPTGRVLDPCRGEGVFERYLWGDTEWCEITEGRDFFDWREGVDWVVGNPPYSLTRRWFLHSYEIADNLLYLVPLRNVFSGYGFLREISDYGGFVEIRYYGTGSKLNFPMGNAVGAVHIARNWRGPTRMSDYNLALDFGCSNLVGESLELTDPVSRVVDRYGRMWAKDADYYAAADLLGLTDE